MTGVLSGKHDNRSIRSHKVMYEVLMDLLFQSYIGTLSSEAQEEIVLFIGKL